MFRSLLCALPLVALLLSGCPSMPVEPDTIEAISVPELEMVRPPYKFDRLITSFSISEDGNTFIGWGKHDGVILFRQSDYSIIEEYYDIDKSQLKYEGDDGRPTGHIHNAGFFNNNTWYFGVVPKKIDGRIGEHIDIHIRSIQPPREIAKYSFSWGGGDKLIANKNHFVVIRESAVNETVMLVDWRTGAHHSLTIPPFLYEAVFIGVMRYPNPLTLTDSSRILAKDSYKKGYYWFLFDPFTQQKRLFDPSTEQKGKLERDAIISPSERYVIDLGESRCKLRKFPAHETVPLKDQEIIGFCSDKFSKIEEWEKPITFFSLDEKFFVIAFRRNIRVYRTEPFQLEFEGNTSGYIYKARLSENGLLATGDGKGFVRVWDIKAKKAVGQHRFFDPGNEERDFSPSLVFHPDGDRLFVATHRESDLYAFQLPKRGTE